MRTIVFAWLLLCFVGCEKEPFAPEPQNRRATGIITNRNRSPREGTYEGELQYSIPDMVDQTIYTQRQITYLNDSLIVIKWWSKPDTCDTISITTGITYTMAFRKASNTCGNQEVFYIWNSSGQVKNDTIFEHGTVEYRFYFEGELRVNRHGQWQSWVKWKSKNHCSRL
jgi:hypothetical protein